MAQALEAFALMLLEGLDAIVIEVSEARDVDQQTHNDGTDQNDGEGR